MKNDTKKKNFKDMSPVERMREYSIIKLELLDVFDKHPGITHKNKMAILSEILYRGLN